MSKKNISGKKKPGDGTLPFLKWPGGKRWAAKFIKKLASFFPAKRYIEPFLGGGAVFFALRHRNAILSDLNDDLINTYRQVKYFSRDLEESLREMPVNKELYLRLRKQIDGYNFDRALRFIYLNRTAFSGLYRTNRLGEFNVPYGGGERTPELIYKNGLLRRAATRLKYASLRACDFSESLHIAEKGDLIYCDPTYTVSHNNNGFIRYNERNFCWEDQIRLVYECRLAVKRGAIVLVSNAYHANLMALYTGFPYIVLQRPSAVCPIINKRRVECEVIFLMGLTSSKFHAIREILPTASEFIEEAGIAHANRVTNE